MFYEEGGFMAFRQNGYLVQPVSSFYMVIYKIMVSCPDIPGATYEFDMISPKLALFARLPLVQLINSH